MASATGLFTALYGISLLVASLLLFFLCKLDEGGTCELIEEEVSTFRPFFFLLFTHFATLVTEGSGIVTHKREILKKILSLLMQELLRQKVLEETCGFHPSGSCGELSTFTVNAISSFAKGSLLLSKAHSKILELTS